MTVINDLIALALRLFRRPAETSVAAPPRKTYPHIFAKALAMHIDAATPGGMRE